MDKDRSLIKKAAETYTRYRLNQDHNNRIEPVDDRDKKGYDLECQGHCAMVFEVKGMIEPSPVILEESEFCQAEQRKQDYCLICVYNLLNNLSEVGYKEIVDPVGKGICMPFRGAKIPKEKWLQIN